MDAKYERFRVPERQNQFISVMNVVQTQKGEMMRRNATQDDTGNTLAAAADHRPA